MNKNVVVICALSMLAGVASAQQVSGQNNASVSSNTSVSAGQSGAGVQSGTNASASSQSSVSAPKHQHHPESKSGGERESGKDQRGGSADASGAVATGTTVNAVLSKPLDSRKCKPGDQVVATASQDVMAGGKVVVKKGSKLIGHITEAKTRGEGQANSSLGIMFDHAIAKNGEQIEMNSVVQAIAMAQTSGASMGDDIGAMGNGSVASTGSAHRSSGVLGGVSSTASGATGAAANVGGNATGAVSSTLNSGANLGTGVSGALNSTSSGVVGLRGLSLATDASNATQGSIITSNAKNIHLESGTQMVLRVVN